MIDSFYHKLGVNTAAPKRKINNLMVLILFIFATLILMTLWQILYQRFTTLETSKIIAENLAKSIDQNADSTFEFTDNIVSTTVYRLELYGMIDGESEQTGVFLNYIREHSPRIYAITVINRDGSVFTTTSAYPNNIYPNYKDREYFQYHETHTDKGSYIGPPIKSKLNGAWILTVSRRINGPNGEFRGVIVASIKLDYFQKLYESLDIGRDGAIALQRDDGITLVRRPFIESNIGRDFSQSGLFRRLLPNAPTGTAFNKALADGHMRLLSYRKLEHFPLVVSISLSEDEIFAVWTQDSLWAVFILIMVLGLVSTMGYRSIRQLRETIKSEARAFESERQTRHAKEAAEKAEQAAAAALAHFQLLADNSTEMIFRLNLDLTCTYVSPSSREIFGEDPATLIGTDLHAAIHPEDRAELALVLQQLKTGRARAALAFRRQQADGGLIWLEASYRVFRNPETNEPSEIFGSMRDVTERITAEEALRESEERFRLLVSGVSDYGIYTLDLDGYICSWNIGAERIKGYTKEEVVGKHFSMFYTEEDIRRNRPMEILRIARENLKHEEEGWRIRKNGTRFWANVILDALHNPQGEIIGFAKITRDVTERTIEEEQRKIIVEAAPIGMLIVNEAGRISLVNSAVLKLFGYAETELIGQAIEILVPDALRKSHVALRDGFVDTEKTARAMGTDRRVNGRRRDGSTFPLQVTLNPIETPRGRIVVTSVIDTSESEAHERIILEAMASAKQAAAVKANFLASMSHEIRTPLNGVLGFTDLLLRTELTPAQERFLQLQRDAGQGLLTVINDILDFSKLDAGKLTIDTIPVNLHDLINSCTQLFSSMAQQKDLSLISKIAPDVPSWVCADGPRLRQIFSNLLSNAIKFTRHGGISFNISAVSSGDVSKITFSVHDTGIGIAPNMRDKLFQQFSQVDGSISREYGGTGLGLAISQQLARLMGGEINVESEPGAGSTFVVSLPLKAVKPPFDAPLILPDIANTGRKIKILVAEDNAINQILIEAILNQNNYSFDIVGNGAEAVSATMNHHYDVILMDMQMPVMDGLKAARRIRSLSSEADAVPIIALTANVLAEEIAQCREAGMAWHLGKPIDAAELCKTIEAAVKSGKPPAV